MSKVARTKYEAPMVELVARFPGEPRMVMLYFRQLRELRERALQDRIAAHRRNKRAGHREATRALAYAVIRRWKLQTGLAS